MKNIVIRVDRIEAVNEDGRRVVMRFDEIKVNGTFVRDMSESDRDAWIARSVTKLQESKS